MLLIYVRLHRLDLSLTTYNKQGSRSTVNKDKPHQLKQTHGSLCPALLSSAHVESLFVHRYSAV